MTDSDQDIVVLPAELPASEIQRRLTAAEFLDLADVPPELEWLANIDNEKTRRAYQRHVRDFMQFAGIRRPEEFRIVKRAHIIAWRKSLEQRELSAAYIRQKLSALSSLFNYLCEQNAIAMNPTKGVTRPNEGANIGTTPAIGDAQALDLLSRPDDNTLIGKRDAAILSVLLYHALRREEVSRLRVKDIEEREGLAHFKVRGKGDKLRFIPIEAGTQRRIRTYMEAAGHGDELAGPLFRPTRNNATGELEKPLSTEMIRNIVRRYSAEAEINGNGIAPHSLRATAGTNALEGGSDYGDVKDWMGHANVSTTQRYDKRRARPEDSPTFKVNYRRRKDT